MPTATRPDRDLRPVRRIARCRCGEVTSTLASYNPNRADADLGGMVNSPFHGWALKCRGCGELRTAKPVKGIYKPEHVCSAKCVESKGFLCECSCGGKNHGSKYAAAA